MLSGCVGGEKNTVYISGDIECEVSFVLDKTSYRATVERRENSVRITYIEPRALAGLTLLHEGENMSAELDGIEINDGIDGLFEIEKFFEYDTQVVSSDLEGNIEQIKLERTTGEGFYVQMVDGEPIAIVGELCGERREIRLIRAVGDMLREIR